MRRAHLLPLCLALLLALPACGGATEPTRAPATAPVLATPEPTPYDGPENPLTGEPIDAGAVNLRPVAVMLNDVKAALPQLGQAKADVIYECLTEGGITRMLGVYQSVEGVGMIGSIRSARPCYLELALGHDALYVHAGGSDEAYAKMRSWGVDHFDAVRGPYEGRTPGSNMMWRDAERRKNNGLEHSVVATGASIEDYLPEDLRRDHEADYAYPLTFSDDGTPADGESAETVSVPFSYYKTTVFHYDAETRKYLVEEYGEAYVDGDTGEQVAVTNVLVVRTAYKNTGDSLGHVTVDLTGSGEGYFACGGRAVPIRWSKADRNSPFVYTTASGAPLALGRGSTYVNIVPLKAEITLG